MKLKCWLAEFMRDSSNFNPADSEEKCKLSDSYTMFSIIIPIAMFFFVILISTEYICICTTAAAHNVPKCYKPHIIDTHFVHSFDKSRPIISLCPTLLK